jgi:hypothetical protein
MVMSAVPLLKICGELFGSDRTILHVSSSKVTSTTKQGPYLTCFVVVINTWAIRLNPFHREGSIAAVALPTLL